jgi:hypothetical protein
LIRSSQAIFIAIPPHHDSGTVVAFDQGDGSHFTAVHFYDLGRLGTAPKLTFVVISSGGTTADEALRIIRSIRCRR